jgi:Leucine-rich repeat (LRR) protein
VKTDLEELWIDDNQIAEIPEDIAHLINLKRFSAYKNNLKTILLLVESWNLGQRESSRG